MLRVVTVASIKVIDNRMWMQYSFIKWKQDNKQYNVKSFNTYCLPMTIFLILLHTASFREYCSVKVCRWHFPSLGLPVAFSIKRKLRNLQKNVEFIIFEWWKLFCFLLYSTTVVYFILAQDLLLALKKISTCHHENLDLSSWKSQSFIMKFLNCHHENYDCS